MKFETFKAMAQAYSEQQKRPPILPKTIQTMTRAYDEICSGEDPWTALGNFTNAWYGYATHLRATLVSDPLTKPEPETEYTHRWAAFCAASVEFLCERYGVSCPDWVHDPSYTLATSWWYTMHPDSLSERAKAQKTAPAPFARRNIFCTNRLFQNKYEMYAWILEAIEQGITNIGEIHDYARQKEISIHGG